MAWFREFTLKNGAKTKIKIEEWCTLQDEMHEFGITENQIFQMQMIEVGQPKNDKKRRR